MIAMDLRTWLSAERGRTARLAARLEIAQGYLSQIADGKRPPKVEQWHIYEDETRGDVMRWDLWPDTWHAIWPQLRRHKNAPALKVAA